MAAPLQRSLDGRNFPVISAASHRWPDTRLTSSPRQRLGHLPRLSTARSDEAPKRPRPHGGQTRFWTGQRLRLIADIEPFYRGGGGLVFTIFFGGVQFFFQHYEMRFSTLVLQVRTHQLEIIYNCGGKLTYSLLKNFLIVYLNSSIEVLWFQLHTFSSL